MKSNYLNFSLIFISSIILISLILAYLETRQFCMTSDFSKDLRVELPEYTYEEYEPEPHAPGYIGYYIIFKEPLPESSKEILNKERMGWKNTSNTIYSLDRKIGKFDLPDCLTAEINLSSGEANLEYSLNYEFSGYPTETLFLAFTLFLLYVLISLIWLCVKVINRIKSNRSKTVISKKY